MTDPTSPFRQREQTSRRQLAGEGGGNGGDYGRLLERIHDVETVVARIDERVGTTATKADLNELKSDMLKWCILTLIAAIAAVATIMSIF